MTMVRNPAGDSTRDGNYFKATVSPQAPDQCRDACNMYSGTFADILCRLVRRLTLP